MKKYERIVYFATVANPVDAHVLHLLSTEPVLSYSHIDRWNLGELDAADGWLVPPHETNMFSGPDSISLDVYCSGTSRPDWQGGSPIMLPDEARMNERIWDSGSVRFTTSADGHAFELLLPGSILTPEILLEGLRRWHTELTLGLAQGVELGFDSCEGVGGRWPEDPGARELAERRVAIVNRRWAS